MGRGSCSQPRWPSPRWGFRRRRLRRYAGRRRCTGRSTASSASALDLFTPLRGDETVSRGSTRSSSSSTVTAGTPGSGQAQKFHIQTLWPQAIVVYIEGLNSPRIRSAGTKPGWQIKAGDARRRDLKLFDAMVEHLRRGLHGRRRGAKSTRPASRTAPSSAYLLWAERAKTIAAVGEVAGRLEAARRRSPPAARAPRRSQEKTGHDRPPSRSQLRLDPRRAKQDERGNRAGCRVRPGSARFYPSPGGNTTPVKTSPSTPAGTFCTVGAGADRDVPQGAPAPVAPTRPRLGCRASCSAIIRATPGSASVRVQCARRLGPIPRGRVDSPAPPDASMKRKKIGRAPVLPPRATPARRAHARDVVVSWRSPPRAREPPPRRSAPGRSVRRCVIWIVFVMKTSQRYSCVRSGGARRASGMAVDEVEQDRAGLRHDDVAVHERRHDAERVQRAVRRGGLRLLAPDPDELVLAADLRKRGVRRHGRAARTPVEDGRLHACDHTGRAGGAASAEAACIVARR